LSVDSEGKAVQSCTSAVAYSYSSSRYRGYLTVIGLYCLLYVRRIDQTFTLWLQLGLYACDVSTTST